MTIPHGFHKSMHTSAYYSYVSGRLKSVKDDPVAIERTLRELQGEIEMRAWYGIWWWTYEDWGN